MRNKISYENREKAFQVNDQSKKNAEIQYKKDCALTLFHLRMYLVNFDIQAGVYLYKWHFNNFVFEFAKSINMEHDIMAKTKQGNYKGFYTSVTETTIFVVSNFVLFKTWVSANYKQRTDFSIYTGSKNKKTRFDIVDNVIKFTEDFEVKKRYDLKYCNKSFYKAINGWFNEMNIEFKHSPSKNKQTPYMEQNCISIAKNWKDYRDWVCGNFTQTTFELRKTSYYYSKI